MANARIGGPTRTYSLGLVALVAIGGAAFWRKSNGEAAVEATYNYSLTYAKPAGWAERPHSPQTLFLYQHPRTKLVLRGATNQVIAEFNPTPELDRDGLTQQFADVTVDNLGWKATILDTVSFKGGSYRLIRREAVDRTVITGIAVRGNTTVLITLLALGDARKFIDAEMPSFRQYLEGTMLTKTVMH